LGLITNIRTYFGKRSLHAESKKFTRVKKPVNLKNAISIGIIYPLGSEEEYNRVSLFTKKLQEQGKKVHVIGLYHYNRVPVFYIPKLSYDLLLPKDIDIFYRPSTQFVTQFINEEFDMLIDLSSPDNFTLQYIAILSRAHFKLGRMIDDRPLPYDLMIDTGPNIDSQELINQIIHYTSNLEFKQNGKKEEDKTE